MPATPSPRPAHCRTADRHVEECRAAGRCVAGHPAATRRPPPLAPSRHRLDADRVVGLFCLLALPAAILLA